MKPEQLTELQKLLAKRRMVNCWLEADLIKFIDEISGAMDKELTKKMMSWIIGNDTGTSSQTIWAAIMGIEMHSPSIPYDPDDFGRCWRLLKICDKITKEKALQEIAKRHEIWKPFVEHWEELEKLFVTGKGEELYTLLQEIRPF